MNFTTTLFANQSINQSIDIYLLKGIKINEIVCVGRSRFEFVYVCMYSAATGHGKSCEGLVGWAREGVVVINTYTIFNIFMISCATSILISDGTASALSASASKHQALLALCIVFVCCRCCCC